MIPKFPLLLTIIMTLCTFGVIAEGEIYYPNYNEEAQNTIPQTQPPITDLDNDAIDETEIVNDRDNTEVYQHTIPPPDSTESVMTRGDNHH